MRQYGIIGNPLGHSWSAQLFNARFESEGINAHYALYPMSELNISTLDSLVRRNRLSGFSVTIPYKQTIIPLLDEVTETAAAIGAVNVVKVEWQGDSYRLVGYNTDYAGFRESLLPMVERLNTDDRLQALVLGTGGAARAVAYALSSPYGDRQWDWEVTFVSRNAEPNGIRTKVLNYSQLSEETVRSTTLIVNGTPLGMSPHIEACPPIPYKAIGKEHILYDCIYNPEQTLFLRKGSEHGAATQNGMQMLKLQAQAAWQIWNKD